MTTAFDPHAYSIVIRRVTEDGERLFHGTVRELPDLATYEATYRRAYDLLIDAIESLHKDADAAGRPFPSPEQTQGEFSGRVTLRMPTSLHRDVARMAENEGSSLNTFIITVLAEQVGQSRYAATATIPTGFNIQYAPPATAASWTTISASESPGGPELLNVGRSYYASYCRALGAIARYELVQPLSSLWGELAVGTSAPVDPSVVVASATSEEPTRPFGGVAASRRRARG